MKIAGILMVVAMISVADVATERICGTQPLRKPDWSYDVNVKREGDNRIINGTDSHPGEWPWQVLLRSKWDNRTSTPKKVKVTNKKCGGILITRQHVLTAAHCSVRPPWPQYRVILGLHDLRHTKEPQVAERGVLRAIIHEKFNKPNNLNDVQVMVMDKPVEFTQYIRPICFPKTDEDFGEKTAWVTGWGRLERKDIKKPNVLQKVAFPIWNYARCDAFLLRKKKFKPNDLAVYLCAGYDGGGTGDCKGDSGGPVVIQRPDKHWTLVGIASFGYYCKNKPGVKMRATFYRDWIEKQIEQNLYYDD